MSDLPQTSKGKVARLPAKLREEINRRLNDGDSATFILPWLNSLPEVQAILAAQFSGEAISPQNLSAWRNGGFQKWLAQREEIDRTRERAIFSRELAKASGGDLGEGALAEFTGEIMELTQEVIAARKAGIEVNPKTLEAIGKNLNAARAKELDTHKHRLGLKRLAQKDRELDLAEEKHQLATCEAFKAWLNDQRAKAIVESGKPHDVQMQDLRVLLFGPRPQTKGDA